MATLNSDWGGGMSISFRAFMENKPAILQAHPGTLDLTETNIVTAFGHLRPAPGQDALPAKAHRCHLAEYWLDAYGLSRSLKSQALVSQGVRHALGLLFAGYAALGYRARLPADIYPVYLEFAARAGLEVSTYLAADSLTLEGLGDAEVLLLTNPAKPWGTWLSEQEIAVVKIWLARDPRRRVIVDAVYTWEASLNPLTMTLFHTGQAIVLHSLSKAWLWPLVFGVALIPKQDVAQWTPVFRAAPPAQDMLRLAEVLLTQHVSFPASLSSVLVAAESRLRMLLLKKEIAISERQPVKLRYHFVVSRSWEALLRESGVLALPAAVFGHSSTDLSIVTSLTAYAIER